MAQEGLIQFNCNLKHENIDNNEIISAINECRTRLFDLGLIGVDENGQGYGNISTRTLGNKFIITASQTGKYRILESEHFILVEKCNFLENQVCAMGKNIPSSESLTHGAVYESDNAIGAVIHIHYKKLWDYCMDKKFISTPDETGFGSVKLANAIIFLFKNSRIREQKIFAMGGHESGVITFGRDLQDAEKTLSDAMRHVEK